MPDPPFIRFIMETAIFSPIMAEGIMWHDILVLYTKITKNHILVCLLISYVAITAACILLHDDDAVVVFATAAIVVLERYSCHFVTFFYELRIFLIFHE